MLERKRASAARELQNVQVATSTAEAESSSGHAGHEGHTSSALLPFDMLESALQWQTNIPPFAMASPLTITDFSNHPLSHTHPVAHSVPHFLESSAVGNASSNLTFHYSSSSLCAALNDAERPEVHQSATSSPSAGASNISEDVGYGLGTVASPSLTESGTASPQIEYMNAESGLDVSDAIDSPTDGIYAEAAPAMTNDIVQKSTRRTASSEVSMNKSLSIYDSSSAPSPAVPRSTSHDSASVIPDSSAESSDIDRTVLPSPPSSYYRSPSSPRPRPSPLKRPDRRGPPPRLSSQLPASSE